MWRAGILILAIGITPALAQQPQRPDQQAASRGWQGGTADRWDDPGPSPGCSSCSTQRSFEKSRWGGRAYEYQRNLRESPSDSAFGADRADDDGDDDDNGDIGNTGGGNFANSHFN